MKLEDLPDEVLRRCFAYVGWDWEVLQLASLSKRLQPIVQEAGLHEIHVPSMDMLSRYARLLARRTGQVDPSAVKILDVDVVSQADESMALSLLLPMVIRHHRNLVCLETVHPGTTEDVNELVEALETLSQLRSLTVVPYRDDEDGMPNASSFGWHHVVRIMDACGRLQHLDIRFAAEPFQALQPHNVTCPDLVSLSLSQPLPSGWLQELLVCTPNLQELRIGFVPELLPGTSPDVLGDAFRNLRSFGVQTLANRAALFAAAMNTLVATLVRLPRLEELHLPRAEGTEIQALLLAIPAALRLLVIPRFSGPWMPVAFFLAEQCRLRGIANAPFDILKLRGHYWRLAVHDREKIKVGSAA
jgi:hypothetical protein